MPTPLVVFAAMALAAVEPTPPVVCLDAPELDAVTATALRTEVRHARLVLRSGAGCAATLRISPSAVRLSQATCRVRERHLPAALSELSALATDASRRQALALLIDAIFAEEEFLARRRESPPPAPPRTSEAPSVVTALEPEPAPLPLAPAPEVAPAVPDAPPPPVEPPPPALAPPPAPAVAQVAPTSTGFSLPPLTVSVNAAFRFAAPDLAGGEWNAAVGLGWARLELHALVPGAFKLEGRPFSVWAVGVGAGGRWAVLATRRLALDIVASIYGERVALRRLDLEQAVERAYWDFSLAPGAALTVKLGGQIDLAVDLRALGTPTSRRIQVPNGPSVLLQPYGFRAGLELRWRGDQSARVATKYEVEESAPLASR